MTAASTRWLRFAVVAIVLVALAHAVDGWVYAHVFDERVYERDWGRLLRVMGFLPLWLLASAALVLNDWPLRMPGSAWPAWRRGVMLLGAATMGGIAAELLKLVFRRERPRAHEGEYVFRAFTDRPLHNGGLALPSSHALVAFAAAAMLSRLFPRAMPIWFLLATGCGYTRVAAQAHFVSDIIVAALVGWLVAAWVWRWKPRSARAAGAAGSGGG
jgi:membrane-associated phospholipid phosphatase